MKPGGRLLASALIALAGALETAWLSIAWLRHGHVPCVATARVSCEALFLASGTMPLGLPLAVWGHAGYASITLLVFAAAWLEGAWAGRALSMSRALAMGMAFFSAFLMARMVMLGAFCPWCVLSALLSGALGALALVDLARGRQSLVPAGWGVALAAGMVAVTLLTGGHRPLPPAGDPARLEAIAKHLSASGARFYGVWWCERCREQKELFGAAALELPYIESSRVVPEGIEEFPTWEIGGRRITGVLSPDSLAELSGYPRSP